MRKLWQRLLNHRMRALIGKEVNQIRRDRRLATSLILPPTVQLLLFGFALSAVVTDVRLGVVDESRTSESRELVAVLTESKSFRLGGQYLSADQLGASLSRGDLDAGIVIPYDYARDLQRGRPVTVQFILNAMNANTAAISQGYALGVLETYNRGLAGQGLHANFQQVAAPDVSQRGQVVLQPDYLYNPGLQGAWFIATGLFGLLVVLNASLVSSVAMVKEREAGTIEQLLMSPAGTWEIILAKIAPLFVLLFFMVLLAVTILKVAFHVPFHGNLLLVLAGAALCVLCGIGIGTSIATFSKTTQQAQLSIFFVNPPLNSLSGALNPVEAMPAWMQPLTVVNPIHHFATIVRACLLKGSGISTLWPNFLGLFLFTSVLVSLSVWRFRKQLS